LIAFLLLNACVQEIGEGAADAAKLYPSTLCVADSCKDWQHFTTARFKDKIITRYSF